MIGLFALFTLFALFALSIELRDGSLVCLVRLVPKSCAMILLALCFLLGVKPTSAKRESLFPDEEPSASGVSFFLTQCGA